MDLKKIMRSISDFPINGVVFHDITTILQDPIAFSMAVDSMAEMVTDEDFDLVIGPESRGFIFGTPVAYKLKKGFVPARKAGKLPYIVRSKTYDLEYGNSTIEMHEDAIKKNQRVIIVDDLLATGGTCKAIANLVEEMGGIVVKMVFLVELTELKGREILKDYSVSSIIQY